MTATTTTAADSLDLVSGKTLVLLGAALKEERPHGRVGFHYGGRRGHCPHRGHAGNLLIRQGSHRHTAGIWTTVVRRHH